MTQHGLGFHYSLYGRSILWDYPLFTSNTYMRIGQILSVGSAGHQTWALRLRHLGVHSLFFIALTVPLCACKLLVDL